MTAVHSYLKISGFPVLQPDALSEEAQRHGVSDVVWRGRANSVSISGGMEPARSYVLVSADVLDKLDVDKPQTLELSCEPRGTSDADQRFRGLDSFALTSQYVYRVQSALAGFENGPAFIELRDARQIYAMSSVATSYNIMTPAEDVYWKASTDNEIPWTWDGMIGDLLNNVPLIQNVSYTEAQWPTFVPEGYRFDGNSAWKAIGDVLRDIQHLMLPRDVLYPIPTNASRAQDAAKQPTWQITESSFVHEPNFDMQADYTARSHIPAIHSSRVPNIYVIVFPDRDYMYQAKDDANLYDAWDAAIETPTHSVEVAIAGGVPGTRLVIHDPMPAKRDAITGQISNGGDLSTRANQVASEHHGRLMGADRDDTYSGLIRFQPDSEVHSVTWFDCGDGWQTRVVHGPREFMRVHPYVTVPDISETHLPVHRKIYGKVTSTESVKPEKTGNAQTLYLDTVGKWVEPDPQKPFTFRNVGLTDILLDDHIYAEWWWQRKEWVAWCGFRAETP